MQHGSKETVMPRLTRPTVISMQLRLSWHPRTSLITSLGRTGMSLIANNTARALIETYIAGQVGYPALTPSQSYVGPVGRLRAESPA